MEGKDGEPAPAGRPAAAIDAINEKKRAGTAADGMAKLFYRLYGIDRYPGYLTGRFAEPARAADELAELASGLKAALAEVEAAASATARRDAVLARYEQKHGELSSFTAAQVIPPATLALLRGGSVGALMRGGEAGAKEESEFIYSLPMLQPEVVSALLEEAEAWAAWRETLAAEDRAALGSVMSGSLVVLDAFPAGKALLDVLLAEAIRPMAAMLYPEVASEGLDYRYGYIIGYGDVARVAAADAPPLLARSALVSHTDDSDVTVNICLGRDFRGGEICFRYLRGDPFEGEEEKRVAPLPGRAVVHLGQHLHQVLPVERGERLVLIIWCRSSAYRSRTCPCCMVYRRVECVCRAEWN
eukprot:PLAT5161.1.p1 GENE.PLAT5161.1~~PLAT5161.1.p1  ORF type:complete len:365 (-),score=97.21 PLAT5161.1:97-1170(-)